MSGKTSFSVHAIKRMFERSITTDDVVETAAQGELVEDYPDDWPYPSRLVLGWPGGRAVHVVVAENSADDEMIVVTVYEPDPAEWEPGFKRRKL